KPAILSLLLAKDLPRYFILDCSKCGSSPESLFLAKMPRNGKYVRRIPGDPSPKRGAQDDSLGTFTRLPVILTNLFCRQAEPISFPGSTIRQQRHVHNCECELPHRLCRERFFRLQYVRSPRSSR